MTLDSSLRPTNTSTWCWSAEWHTSRTRYVNTVHFPTAKSQDAIPCLKAVGLNPGTEIPRRLPRWPTTTCIDKGRTRRASLFNRLYIVTCGLVLFTHYFRLQLWQAFPYPPPCPLITRRHDMGRSGLYSNFKTLLHSLSLRTTEDEYEWRRMRSDMEAAVACKSPVRVWKYIPQTFQDSSNRPRCSNNCQTQHYSCNIPGCLYTNSMYFIVPLG